MRKTLGVMIFPDRKLLQTQAGEVASPDTWFKSAPQHADSSVAAIEYTVDGIARQPQKNGIRITAPGRHVIRARGVTLDGSRGEEAVFRITIDALPPRIGISLTELPRDKSGHVVTRVVLDATDDTGVASFQYRLDDGPFRGYAGPLLLKAEQEYELEIRATDVVGNRSYRRQITFRATKTEK